MSEKRVKRLNELLEEGEVGTAVSEFGLKLPKGFALKFKRSFMRRRKMDQPWGWKRGMKLIHSKKTKGRTEITIVPNTTGEI